MNRFKGLDLVDRGLKNYGQRFIIFTGVSDQNLSKAKKVPGDKVAGCA